MKTAITAILRKSRTSVLCTPWTVVAVLALGTVGSSPAQAQDSRFIANGTKAATCAFPSVVCVNNCSCTGTLVHPQLVLFAAHCGKASSITFGEGSGGGPSVSVTKSMVQPDYDISDGDNHTQIAIDWAFAVLDKPVTGVPITPAVYGCEADAVVKEGGEIFQVGFGSPNSGTKFWKANTIRKLYDGVIETAGGGVGCPGDSGGPLLMRMEDNSWRTVGVTSTLVPELSDCGKEAGYNNYSRIRRDMLEWVETESGIDVTVCYTLDGVFEPTAECANMFAGEPESSGSWSDECKDIDRVDENTICMAADTTAPEVAFDAPKDGATIEEGKSVQVEVSASDDDAVATVVLAIDGKAQDELTASPYEWKLDNLDVGEHELVATATDKSGNQATAQLMLEIVPIGDTGEDSSSSASTSTSASSNDSQTADSSGQDQSNSASDTTSESDSENSGVATSSDSSASSSQSEGGADTTSGSSGCSSSARGLPGLGGLALTVLGFASLLGGRRRRSSRVTTSR